jgi:hypothetical protein
MAHAQILTAAKVFTTPITNPACKLKPSWHLVAKDDKTINPDLERMYAERAHSHKVEAEEPATPSTSRTPKKWRLSSRRPPTEPASQRIALPTSFVWIDQNQRFTYPIIASK